MKKKVIAIISGVVVVAIAVGLISLFGINKENELSTEDVVLEKNVSVVTNETAEDEQPYKIDENHLYYKSKPDLKKDDVIVSGITEAAPTGFMRKIVSVEKLNGEYVVETLQASFSDVFKEVNFQDSIDLTEDTTSPPEIKPQGKLLTPTVTPLSYDSESSVFLKIKEKTIDEDGIYALVNGSLDLKIHPKLQVVDGNVIFDLLWENGIDSSIYFFNREDINGTIEKELRSYSFMPREFYIGAVPVVLTNEVGAYLKVDGEITGEVSVDLEMNDKISQGFKYVSNENTYSQNDDSEAIKNNTEIMVSGPLEVDAAIGLFIDSSTTLYDGLTIENTTGLKTTISGDIRIEELPKSTNGARYGVLETLALSSNVVEFMPGEPLCTDLSDEPINFEREDYLLWEDKTAFNGPIAPGEAWIASHFYEALDFYEHNLYGREYRVSKQEQPTKPFDEAVLFNGEWLAPYPYNNFTTYEDFVDQCSEYFNITITEAIRHSIAGEDYKGAFYSRFHWGIGDYRNSDYNVNVKEIKLDEYTYYYEIYGSFENIAGEQVKVEMDCNYVNGKWIFDRCAFYGDDF